MADSNTTTYSFTLPEVGASADSWGTKLNANWDKVDDLLDGSIAVNGITVTGGSIDGTPVGATTPSTGAFTTVTTTGNVDVTGTVTADGLTVENSTSSTVANFIYTGGTDAFLGLDGTGTPIYLGNKNGDVVFQTSGSGYADKFRIANNGNVEFYEDTGTTAKMVWSSSAENLSINSGGKIPLSLDSDGSETILKLDNSSTNGRRYWLISGGAGGSFSGGKFGVYDADSLTTPFVINSSGNVGIGTASPASKLELSGIGTGVWLTLDRQDTNTNIIDFTETGTRLGYVGYVGDNLIINNAKTSSTTFNITNAEKMRLDSSGNLLVGTTTSSAKLTVVPGTSQAGIHLSQQGSASTCIVTNSTNANTDIIKFDWYGSKIGSISNSGGVSIAYNTTSDERLKENIQDTTHTVDINDIQVREFDWKINGSHQRFGFIAQELETVYPEAVHSPDEADEMKSVDYSKLVPLLVKEIQTLKTRIETLENN